MTILFYDSGMGGISTLNETIKLLKGGDYVYFADNANCPYGDKPPDEIERLVKERLNWLLKRFNIQMVVFACNTITTACIDKIRAFCSLPIVGTEPAITYAMKKSFSKQILVLATVATIGQSRLKKLAERAGGEVFFLPLSGLADEIERAAQEGKAADLTFAVERIREELNKHPKIDAIVLGCTHYCFVKSELEEWLKLPCYDGNFGVAKRVGELLYRDERPKEGRLKVKVLATKGKKSQTLYRKMVMKIKV